MAMIVGLMREFAIVSDARGSTLKKKRVSNPAVL